MADHFNTELRHRDGLAVLTVVGEIDASTAPELRDVCLELVPETDGLVLDLAGVTFMGSSGLHVLIEMQQQYGPSSVLVRNASDQVRKLLQITGLAAQLLEPVVPHTDQSSVDNATTDEPQPS